MLLWSLYLYSIVSSTLLTEVVRLKTISMNKECKVEMTLFEGVDVVYCQIWNVIRKIAQKFYTVLLF